MDKFVVNIYIETTTHGPAVRQSSYGYVVEYHSKMGIPVTREGFGSDEAGTENKLVLMAMCDAISKLKKPCSIRVFTQCAHVLNAFGGFWPSQWKANDWKNAKGKSVKNAEQWETLMNLLEDHVISFSNDENVYGSWIRNELEKERK